MSCTNCFEDWVCKCVPYGSIITLNAYLTPFTEYTYVVTDKFGSKYTGTDTTDGFGHLEINTVSFPEGFFTEFSGRFKIQIMTSDNCEPIKFYMAGQYDCVEIEIKGGTMNKDEIGCDIPNVSVSVGGGGG